MPRKKTTEEIVDEMKSVDERFEESAKKMEYSLTEAIPLAPPLIRDENGLIVGKEYQYLPDGRIDWKAMLDPKYMVLNRQKKDEIEKIYNKKFNEVNIIEDNVDDKYCLLLLGGVREILDLRGYESVEYRINLCTPEFVSVTCRIKFLPNYEGGKSVYEHGADAHFGNTFQWYSQYLTAAAFNRALCLCVRNYLKINIVSYDEIGPNKTEDRDSDSHSNTLSVVSPHFVLQKKMDEKKVSFEKIKAAYQKKHQDADLSAWVSIDKIPASEVMGILGAMEKKEAEKNQEKESVHVTNVLNTETY